MTLSTSSNQNSWKVFLSTATHYPLQKLSCVNGSSHIEYALKESATILSSILEPPARIFLQRYQRIPKPRQVSYPSMVCVLIFSGSSTALAFSSVAASYVAATLKHLSQSFQAASLPLSEKQWNPHLFLRNSLYVSVNSSRFERKLKNCISVIMCKLLSYV